jgi:DNA mismatch repair protein MutL
LPPDTIPSYFIYFDLDPADIDVNIHPTKTEIKFENESAIWQILQASVREALGKFNIVPSIDFDQAGSVDIPMPLRDYGDVHAPEIKVNPAYNPFEQSLSPKYSYGNDSGFKSAPVQRNNLTNWQSLYKGVEPAQQGQGETSDEPIQFRMEEQQTVKSSVQFKNKYILTPVKSGLMVIDQKRAHERILYERLIQVMETHEVASQQQLFPETFELNASDATLLLSILPDLKALGFDIREYGSNTFINGTPGVLNTFSPVEIIESLLEEYKLSPADLQGKARETVAISLAQASAIPYGHALKPIEISELIDNLFACQTPNFSPRGKKILSIMPLDDFEKLLK